MAPLKIAYNLILPVFTTANSPLLVGTRNHFLASTRGPQDYVYIHNLDE